jgi:hypothetical protein
MRSLDMSAVGSLGLIISRRQLRSLERVSYDSYLSSRDSAGVLGLHATTTHFADTNPHGLTETLRSRSRSGSLLGVQNCLVFSAISRARFGISCLLLLRLK